MKRGVHRPPECPHGTCTFAGADAKPNRSKCALPTGKVSARVYVDQGGPPASSCPREVKRWKSLYRGRAAVEREVVRLKSEWSLLPLRVRGSSGVRVHADLTILAKVACALSRARAVPLTA